MRLYQVIQVLINLSVLYFIIPCNGRCAYVTHIDKQGDVNRIKGAIVLGNSIEWTKSTLDRIILISNPIDEDEAMMLQESGWTVLPVAEIDSPKAWGTYHPSTRFGLTKIHLFGMVEYERLIYMDPHMSVTQNIDHLCEVPATFAAVEENSIFDTSMMVISPSTKLYNDSRYAVKMLVDEYEGMDDGFFNLMFWDINYCTYFDPLADMNTSCNAAEDSSFSSPYSLENGNSDYNEDNEDNERSCNPTIRCARLPHRYNGNIVRYTLFNRWTFAPVAEQYTEPHVVNYMFSYDILPWNWPMTLFIGRYKDWWHILRMSYSPHDTFMAWMSYLWRQVLLALFFYHTQGYLSLSTIFKKPASTLDNNPHHLESPYIRVVWTTLVSWMGFIFSLLFSEFYALVPLFNIIIFVQCMQISMEISLFAMLDDLELRGILRRAYPFSLSILLLFLYFCEPLSFFARIFVVLLYAICFHFISFTYVSADNPLCHSKSQVNYF